MKKTTGMGKKHRVKADVQAFLDEAPVRSKRAGYLKLPKNMKFFQPKKDEEMRLVFIPWTAGKGNKRKGGGTINRYLNVHRNIGPEEHSVLCPASVGKKCPQCEEFARLRNKGRGPDHWNKIKDLRPQIRELYLVHDLDGEKDNIQLWDESSFLFGDHLRLKISRKEKYKNFSDPDNPMMVAILGTEKKWKEGSTTHYSSIEFEDLDSDVDMSSVYDKAAGMCPDDWVLELTYDKIKKMIDAEPEDDEDEDEDEDKDEDEDEDKDEDEDEDEDKDEDEDEDKDEDEDEDEDMPYKKGSRVKYKNKEWTVTKVDGSMMFLKDDGGKTAKIGDPDLVSLVEKEEEEEEPEEEPEEIEEEEEPEEKPKRGRKPKK